MNPATSREHGRKERDWGEAIHGYDERVKKAGREWQMAEKLQKALRWKRHIVHFDIFPSVPSRKIDLKSNGHISALHGH